jgi:hypothetical protein
MTRGTRFARLSALFLNQERGAYRRRVHEDFTHALNDADEKMDRCRALMKHDEAKKFCKTVRGAVTKMSFLLV